jgi:hypothetical protein
MVNAFASSGTARVRAVLLLVLGLLFTAHAVPALAENPPAKGTLAGIVHDAETKKPLGYANVVAYRTSENDPAGVQTAGMLSRDDGTYSLEVPAGTYRVVISYLSYKPAVLEGLAVAAGETTDRRVSLAPETIVLQGITVTRSALRAEEAAVLAKQRKAAAISDAVSSEQISRTTDSNAAEALQRVTGLSVLDGRYVYVRGLGDRYSATEVNGARIGSPEPNKRALPLDIFPSNVLDNVTVQKSYTPDQDAEFGGGLIQLNTKDFVEGRSLSQSAATGYLFRSGGSAFWRYPGGRTDWLGIDDGTRALPATIKKLAGDQPVVTRGLAGNGFTEQQIQEMGRAFNDVWLPRRSTLKPNYSYSGSYATGFDLFGREVGFLTSLSLSNSFSTMTKKNNAYSGTSGSGAIYEYDVKESTARVLWGSVSNLSLRLNEKNALKLRALYTRSADDRAGVSVGPNYDYGAEEVRLTRLEYVERGVFSGVLSGEHEPGIVNGARIQWNYGYSAASRDEPDRRETRYERNEGDAALHISGRTQYPVTRIFGDMDEHQRSLDASLLLPTPRWTGVSSKLKIGWALRNRDRVSSYRRFGYRSGRLASSLDNTLSPEEYYADENIVPNSLELVELTRGNDSYRGWHDIHAEYAQFDVGLSSRLRAVGGVRVETSDQRVESQSPFVRDEEPAVARLEATDILPSVNLTWGVTKNANLRAGYSRTVSRPELRELSPFSMYDYETGYSEIGDPELRTAYLASYDVRAEVYPSSRELLAASVFTKDLERPLVKMVEASSGTYLLRPQNAERGKLYGVEIEARLGVGNAWRAVDAALPFFAAPRFADRWAVTANYSRVETETEVLISKAADGERVIWTGPLVSQAGHAVNLGLFYASGGFEGSMNFAAFGKRLAQIGAGQYPNKMPDIYEYPMKSLDLVVNQRVSSWLRARLAAENLLDDEVEYLQADNVTRSYRPGRTVSFSLGVNR